MRAPAEELATDWLLWALGCGLEAPGCAGIPPLGALAEEPALLDRIRDRMEVESRNAGVGTERGMTATAFALALATRTRRTVEPQEWKVLEQVQPVGCKKSALQRIIAAAAGDAGALDVAFRVFRKLSRGHRSGWPARRLAIAYAERGDLERLGEVLSLVSDARVVEDALRSLVAGHAAG